MTLEQQVCSLELAKRLKELGVKQESLLYWVNLYKKDYKLIAHTIATNLDWYHGHKKGLKPFVKRQTTCSAFTVAELGEMLPFSARSYVGSYGRNDDGTIAFKNWVTDWWEIAKDWESSKEKFAGTEADSRAKMLIYLLENKLTTL